MLKRRLTKQNVLDTQGVRLVTAAWMFQQEI